jgi:hypothetical protein
MTPRFVKLACLVFLGSALLSIAARAAAPASPVHARFHVDPDSGDDTAVGTAPRRAFRTLERARDAARAVPGPWSGDVEIILHGERHSLTRPLELRTEDSGRDGHSLRFVAAPGSRPVLDGGRRITGWALYDSTRGIWRAPAPADLSTRQLFVNGRRALRARSIAGPADIVRTDSGYTLPATAALGAWKNSSDLEFVYRHIWTNPRVGVARIERRADQVLVTMRQPGFDNARNKGITSIDLPWYLENAYELIDQPGEWYHDRTGAISGTGPAIYYLPHDWENVARSDFVVPVLEQLIVIKGDSLAAPVHHVAFSGITFAHTTWLRPSGDYGLPDAQNNVMRENFDADRRRLSVGREFVADGAALRARHARAISIEDCRFLRLGGIGVSFGAGAQDVLILGNLFFDLSGTGIQLGDYLDWRVPESENFAAASDPRLHLARNRIENNYLERCGIEFRSSTAIAISFPRESVIAHNELAHLPYSGMHLGWGWGTFPATATGGNLIEHNFVRNVMVELADGGSIYTLGASDPQLPPTVLRRNDSLLTRWGQGFYFDEGSSRYRADANRFERIGDANIKINGKENHDIVVTGLYSEKERNIVTKSLDWSRNALRIDAPLPLDSGPGRPVADDLRAQAGLSTAYRHLRPSRLDAVLYELEEGTPQGPAMITTGMDLRPVVTGYSDMAYVDMIASAAGGGIEFPALRSRSGSYEIRLRYAAEKETSGLAWRINGKTVALPPLPATGDRSTWTVIRVVVHLRAGENLLSLFAAQPSPGFFQADRVELVPLRVSPARSVSPWHRTR